jgi:hypothetical protein
VVGAHFRHHCIDRITLTRSYPAPHESCIVRRVGRDHIVKHRLHLKGEEREKKKKKERSSAGEITLE